MAQSPAHKFGQIIGNVLEASVEPMLDRFAREHGLFLDKAGPRPARRGNKVTWLDKNGNSHDLDFVFERGGTPEHQGTPVAFIETAWRRYTKHSRNKAQEIQGSIEPLMATYQNVGVFAGAILAGVFTDGAIKQLRSLGFSVLYFPYQTVVEAFDRIGIDAAFDERTADAEFARRIRAWDASIRSRQLSVSRTLVDINKREVQTFFESLRRVVTRRLASVRVLPLHGNSHELRSLQEAIDFVQGYEEGNSKPLVKYEIQVRYNNGDRIEGQFADKVGAVTFLRSFAAM